LQQHARGAKRDFPIRLGLGIPLRERLDITGGDGNAVLVSQEVLGRILSAKGSRSRSTASDFARESSRWIAYESVPTRKVEAPLKEFEWPMVCLFVPNSNCCGSNAVARESVHRCSLG
jgi:hypothetical protein